MLRVYLHGGVVSEVAGVEVVGIEECDVVVMMKGSRELALGGKVVVYQGEWSLEYTLMVARAKIEERRNTDGIPTELKV
jgi:hypothetical protein